MDLCLEGGERDSLSQTKECVLVWLSPPFRWHSGLLWSYRWPDDSPVCSLLAFLFLIFSMLLQHQSVWKRRWNLLLSIDCQWQSINLTYSFVAWGRTVKSAVILYWFLFFSNSCCPFSCWQLTLNDWWLLALRPPQTVAVHKSPNVFFGTLLQVNIYIYIYMTPSGKMEWKISGLKLSEPFTFTLYGLLEKR